VSRARVVKRDSSSLAELRNLGPKSQAMLAKAGIDSQAKLKRIGAVAAYVMTKRANKAVSLNLLYGLVGSIEDCDWKQVKWERKLELLSAIEDYELRHPIQSKQKASDELSGLRNIGKAMRQDFELLGIKSVQQLSRCNADTLYAKIQSPTTTRHDPCVWDTYAAAIHQAKTGEALPWWEFTKVRKSLEAKRRSDSLPPSWGRARERGSSLQRSAALRSTPHPALSAGQDVRMTRAHGRARAAHKGRG
jgi:hypothetical protein